MRLSVTSGRTISQGVRSRKRVPQVVLAVAALSLSLAACSSSGGSSSGSSAGGSSGKGGLVYFMLPNTTPTRYIQQDAPDFTKSIKELDPSIKVQVVNAGGSSATQLSQAQTAIAAGAKALVVVAADPTTSAGLLQAAAAAKIPVIGYENPPLKGPMYAQVEFDPENAGAVQAQYFADQVTSGALGATPVTLARLYGNEGDNYTTQMLKGQATYIDPLVAAGKVKVVCESYVKNWDPAVAQTDMEQCLTKTQNNVKAVLGFYDGITAGAIAALKSHSMTGKVMIYGGQNPELSGLQYMLTGDQQDDVIKAFPTEAKAAAQLAYAAVQGQAPTASLITGSINNGTNDIPTALLKVEYIHLSPGADPGPLVQKAVDYGMFSWKDICTGVAASTATCKAKNP
jgi:D-xylose transport system substrate-binding protein